MSGGILGRVILMTVFAEEEEEEGPDLPLHTGHTGQDDGSTDDEAWGTKKVGQEGRIQREEKGLVTDGQC